MIHQALLMILILLSVVQSSADFASDCLNAHNAYRIPLNITSLSWSVDIAKSAQAWAENLAAQRKLVHSPLSSNTTMGSISTSASNTSMNEANSSGSNSSTNQNVSNGRTLASYEPFVRQGTT